MARIASVEDFREHARRRLPHMLFEYIDGGSYAERTLRRNVGAMDALALRQRVLKDSSQLEFGVRLFDQDLAMPLILAPIGFAGMFARRGEIQAARAAAAHGVPFSLSSLSICDYAEVARGVGVPPWFQCYVIRDRGYMEALLDRVWDGGARVLLLTVDLPTPAARYREVRSGFTDRGLRGLIRQAASGLRHPGWLWDVYLRGRPHVFGNFTPVMGAGQRSLGDYWSWVRENFDTSVNWADLEALRRRWKGKIIVKGILDAEDARIAASLGVDGVVVSNHGGRQLDGVRSAIEVLPEIVAAVGEQTSVLMDGGVRSGLDVLRGLALGARGCLIGRAWAFALAARGGGGVTAMLDMLKAELRVAMMLTGCTDLRDATPALIDRGAMWSGDMEQPDIRAR